MSAVGERLIEAAKQAREIARTHGQSLPADAGRCTECDCENGGADCSRTAQGKAGMSPGKICEITYRNWRGEIAQRRIIPISFRFGTSDWHKVPGWLMLAWDVDKQVEREFSLEDCDFLSGKSEV